MRASFSKVVSSYMGKKNECSHETSCDEDPPLLLSQVEILKKKLPTKITISNGCRHGFWECLMWASFSKVVSSHMGKQIHAHMKLPVMKIHPFSLRGSKFSKTSFLLNLPYRMAVDTGFENVSCGHHSQKSSHLIWANKMIFTKDILWWECAPSPFAVKNSQKSASYQIYHIEWL